MTEKEYREKKLYYMNSIVRELQSIRDALEDKNK